MIFIENNLVLKNKCYKNIKDEDSIRNINEISDEWQRFDFHNHGILKTKPSSTGLTIFRRA